ncbi:SDR family oxidoreductase [uncultured Jatrophihabitans sp.]|uniref:SDR family oxidoreductase n=1 Tax=uncultured Jatrophihabitans sp. TaxID=1610747 RepID=UPI0035CB3D02
MRIAVAGGTGLVGRLVVQAARDAGHDTVVLSRTKGSDVLRGTGVDEALAGADVVVDVTNSVGTSRAKSVAFFGTATPILLSAAGRAGVAHHVALSIVGIDRVPNGYYAGKLEQEKLVADGPVPWTVLRATQFHEFAGQLLGQTKGPVAPVPRMRSAPVAAAEVAHRLVEIATGAPLGRAPEFAGPETHEMPDLARRLLRHRGTRRLVVPVPVPGEAGRAMATGGLLPGPDAVLGSETFDQWLARQPG